MSTICFFSDGKRSQQLPDIPDRGERGMRSLAPGNFLCSCTVLPAHSTHISDWGLQDDHNKKHLIPGGLNRDGLFCFSLGNLTIKLKMEKHFPSKAKAEELNTTFRISGTRKLSSSSSGQTGFALHVHFWVCLVYWF